MTDRPTITLRYDGASFECKPGETILDCLERNAMPVASSCRNGVCQTCMLRALEGAPPAASQAGLKQAWREQGFFLACRCVPTEPMSIGGIEGAGLSVSAVVMAREPLGDRAIRLRLRPAAHFDYRAGQFVHLIRPDGLSRPYSLASVPKVDDELELHIGIRANGAMSTWVRDTLAIGDQVTLRGPSGECFYTTDDPAQPLLLVGIGVGLGSMVAVARDALEHDHRGAIHVVHATASGRDLDPSEALRSFAANTDQVTPHWVALDRQSDERFTEGHIVPYARQLATSLKGARAYLCGDGEQVNALKRNLFLAGISLGDIHADAFVGAQQNHRRSSPP